jgi:hypothetical protein
MPSSKVPSNPENVAREIQLQDALQEQLRREEQLWKQKSQEVCDAIK